MKKTFCYFFIICFGCATTGTNKIVYISFNEKVKNYLNQNPIDPIEGLYTVSDDIFYDYPWHYTLSNDKRELKEHWAKVALIKDQSSITRNYIVKVIEANGFFEQTTFAEFLRVAQSENLFSVKHHTTSSLKIGNATYQFIPEEGRIESTPFKEKDFNAELTIKRTFWKYYPK